MFVAKDVGSQTKSRGALVSRGGQCGGWGCRGSPPALVLVTCGVEPPAEDDGSRPLIGEPGESVHSQFLGSFLETANLRPQQLEYELSARSFPLCGQGKRRVVVDASRLFSACMQRLPGKTYRNPTHAIPREVNAHVGYSERERNSIGGKRHRDSQSAVEVRVVEA